MYWSSIEYYESKGKGIWVSSYTREEQKKLTWAPGQPNGYERENGKYTQPCTGSMTYGDIERQGLFDTPCDGILMCSICEIPERVTFTLRGLNPESLKVDIQYTLYPQLQDRLKNVLVLEGNHNNKMEIQFHSDTWNVSIIRESDNAILINTSNSPFEKSWWTDASDQSRELIVTKVRRRA